MVSRFSIRCNLFGVVAEVHGREYRCGGEGAIGSKYGARFPNGVHLEQPHVWFRTLSA